MNLWTWFVIQDKGCACGSAVGLSWDHVAYISMQVLLDKEKDYAVDRLEDQHLKAVLNKETSWLWTKVWRSRCSYY